MRSCASPAGTRAWQRVRPERERSGPDTTGASELLGGQKARDYVSRWGGPEGAPRLRLVGGDRVGEQQRASGEEQPGLRSWIEQRRDGYHWFVVWSEHGL